MTELPVLDAEEQRVLGSLMEKQTTVPATYPLTANALRSACNQTSNRDPVMDLDQQSVERLGRSLKDRGLLRIVWADSGRRTLKYHQVLDERLGLEEDERALLAVLLLRGPQTPGELRARTERLHAFADRTEVEACLRRMAARPAPLVHELERRPGQHDRRWAHLLGPMPEQAAPTAPAVDRDAVIAGGPELRDARVRAAYDTVAQAYAAVAVDEFRRLPFDTWLLGRVAEQAAGRPVVEVGCGPGHVAAYLAELGADVLGIDVSPAMVEEARRRFPAIGFEVGDLRRLARPASASGWSAVLAWFSLVHLAPSELPAALAALARPLDPGGWLVLALHVGAEVNHLAEWFGHDVDIDFVRHDPAYVVGLVEAAGLVDVEWYVRSPAAERAESSPRLYVVARRAG